MNIFRAIQMIRAGRPVRICFKKEYMIIENGKLLFQKMDWHYRFQRPFIYFNPVSIISNRWQYMNKEGMWLPKYPDKKYLREMAKLHASVIESISVLQDQKKEAEPKIFFHETNGEGLSSFHRRILNNLDYKFYIQQAELTIKLGLVQHVKDSASYIRDNKWKKDDNIVFAENESHVVVGIAYWTYGEYNEECMLHGLYVEGSHRGEGVGRRLLEHTLKNMEDMYPGKSISLTVLPNDLPAINLYKKFGFDTVAYTRLVRKGKQK